MIHSFNKKGFWPLGRCAITADTKKADVAEHLEAFDHVGLLFNEPLGRAELPFV
jgi:hypothetical protein